ncbi:hypothetical protein KS4_29690 [Poriferisphaera corsica]|uniref:Uncharacterized protein n=1 Tax=Poriferisphaera corsica TaxID=2528020 RepID=A0A517YXG0_9BACT|nr:hypothetical protein [Poriferisphaera corsica]QDU34893.1 hypothetical protein KS4_29690 [Poriferisphaera corsica]
MQKISISLLASAIVLVLTAVSVAQWGDFDKEKVDRRSVDADTITTGELEYLVIDDKEYRPGDFGGAWRVAVYKDFVKITKSPNKSAAVIIPMQNLKYLVLD